MGKKVTRRALNQQLRAVFGPGVRVDHEQTCSVSGRPALVTIAFTAGRIESLEMLKQRILGRLDRLPARDE